MKPWLPNVGPLHHDRFLYDDGKESGYYSDSTVRRDDQAPPEVLDTYRNVGPHLDDEILRQAEENVKPRWDRKTNPDVPDYNLLWHNCQDYADEVEKEYDRLLEERRRKAAPGS